MPEPPESAPPVAVPASDPWPGSTVAGRFAVGERIATGAMGAVYRARQLRVGREIALKILRPERAYDAEAKARFEREARATSQLVSPHTVTAFDFGEAEDGALFLAMELLEGETLGARLKRETRLPIDQAVRVAREALLSLGEAHAKGIVHRDLKPENIFLARVPGELGEVEVCKLLDFGIAKILHGEAGVDALETQAGTVFGTPRYMSPEQAAGRVLDGRSDLYSLGIILYQMLAGVVPFPDEDAVVVMARHIKSPPRALAEAAPDAGIPPELEEVVLAALAKRPEDRPATAEAFLQRLDDAMEAAGRRGLATSLRRMVTRSLPPPSQRKSRPDPLEAPPPRRAPWVVAGLAIAVALVAVAAVASSWRTSVAPVAATASAPPPPAPPATELAPPSQPPATAQPATSGEVAPAPPPSGSATPPRGATPRVPGARPAPKPTSTPAASAPTPPPPASPYRRFE